MLRKPSERWRVALSTLHQPSTTLHPSLSLFLYLLTTIITTIIIYIDRYNKLKSLYEPT
jgi:hypothetical protein